MAFEVDKQVGQLLPKQVAGRGEFSQIVDSITSMFYDLLPNGRVNGDSLSSDISLLHFIEENSAYFQRALGPKVLEGLEQVALWGANNDVGVNDLLNLHTFGG